MKLSAIVPLPMSVADDKAAAFGPLAGEAPLLRIVRAMVAAVADPGGVVVAAAQPLVDDVREILATNDLTSVGVAAASDPGARAECLAAGLGYIERERDSSHVVLVHDIRQPLVSVDLCDRVIAGLGDGSAVVMPARAVTDSVKVVDETGSVTSTLDRSTLRAVQYPRGFAVDHLAELLARRTSDDFDELSEAARGAAPIKLVDGDAEAFAVDLPRDAGFLEAVIASRRPDSRDS